MPASLPTAQEVLSSVARILGPSFVWPRGTRLTSRYVPSTDPERSEDVDLEYTIRIPERRELVVTVPSFAVFEAPLGVADRIAQTIVTATRGSLTN